MIKYAKRYIPILFYVSLYIAMQLLFINIAYNFKGSLQSIVIPQSGHLFYINTPILMLPAVLFSFTIYNIVFLIKKKNMYNSCSFTKSKFNYIIAGLIFGISLSSLLTAIIRFENIYSIFDLCNLLLRPEIKESVLYGKVLKNTVFISMFSIISIGIIIPIFEEILFRGIIFDELRKYHKLRIAVIIQALIFGFAHFNIKQGVLGVFLGILLALMLVWTKSIWTSVVIHVFINLTTVTVSQINMLYEKIKLLYNPTIYSTADVISTFVKRRQDGEMAEMPIILYPLWIKIVCITIFILVSLLCLYYLWKNREREIVDGLPRYLEDQE